MRSGWIHALLVLLAGAAAHRFQRRVDEVRFERGEDETLYFPNPAALKVAVLGYDTAVADLVWVDAVLRFVDIYEGGETDQTRWFAAAVQTVITLDPSWRTAYFYGGSMLRVLGAIDESDRVYRQGMEALPDDPFFPFSLGMNAYLYHHDRAEAARWLARAARLPSAPAWYGAAAASFLDEQGERRAALRYLKEELDRETRPAVREALRERYLELLHDELADRLEGLREAWEREHGRPLPSVDALGELPPDPYGGEWILAPDGAIRSSVREVEEAARARWRERDIIRPLKRPGAP